MRYVLIATAAFLAAPAAAQDLPPVAGQNVEITVTGTGEAVQEPQGFQLTAMFFGFGEDNAARRRAARAAIEEVGEWDLPYRTNCLSTNRFGFMGGDRVTTGAVSEEAAAAAMMAEGEESDTAEPLYYFGQFADEESLARASERLRAADVQIVSTMAVAFDCSEAEHAARTAALADAYAQAQMLADELGMRTVGMTAADFSGADREDWLLTAMLGVGGEDESLVAHATADVTFTFERRTAN